MYYIKDSSGSIRLEILDKIAVKYGLGGIRLFSRRSKATENTRLDCQFYKNLMY